MYGTRSNHRLQKRQWKAFSPIHPGSHQPPFLLLLLLVLLPVSPTLATPPHCLEPHPAHRCRGAFVVGHRFYFDPETSDCLRFFHWGCDGENSFLTKQSCLETCMSDGLATTTLPAPSPSSLPTTTAPPVTQQPTLTLEEICRQPLENYFCPDAYTALRWFYNWSTGQCQLYLSFNCLSNGNTFSTEELCMSKCGQFSTGSGSVVPSQSSHTLPTTLMPVTAETSTPTPTHTSLSISTHSSLKITSTTHISSTVQTPTITPPASDQRPTIGAKTTPVSYKNVPTLSDESPQPTVQDIDTSSAPPCVGSLGILLLTVFLLVVQELY